MAKKEFDIDKYREEMVTSLTVLKADVRHIKETLVDQRTLLREQNGRVRNNENAVARLNVIASLMITIIAGFVTWLFGFKI